MFRSYFTPLVKLICICLIVMLLPLEHTWGQCIIKGKVTDTTKSPIPFAAIALMKPRDSSIIAGKLTDEKGIFAFDSLKAGSYMLKIAVIGYKDHYSRIIKVNDSNKVRTIGLELSNDNNTLKEVSIVASKPFVQHQMDKTTYNISENSLMEGRNGTEILQGLPGIIAPDGGSISIAGKDNTLIMIDGRLINLSGEDASEYLKSFDASQIERVEIITNPSVKYDAAGGGIINIILKKGTKIGFNGNVSATDMQSYYNTGNGSINGNYRTKKINVFGNIGIGNSHSYSTSTNERDFTATTPEQVFNENNSYTRWGSSLSGRVGLDYMPDEEHTFGVSANGHYSYSSFNNNYATLISNGNLLDSSTYAGNSGNSFSSYTSYDTYYRYKIDSTDKEFSLDFSYAPYSNTPTSNEATDFYNNDGAYLREPEIFNLSTPNFSNNTTIKADYTLPINKKSKFETGAKAYLFQIDDNAEYWNIIHNTEVTDTIRSNHFNLKENIYSGYVYYSNKVGKKLNFSIGVRGEYTTDNGIQYVHDTTFSRGYFNYFPNGRINWNIDSNNTLNAYYNQGIQRPWSGQLNPFLQYSTPYSYYTGNTRLMPALTYNYELSYNYKSLISISTEYNHSANLIQSIWEPNNVTHISYSIPVNVASSNHYILSLSTYINKIKWWTLMAYCNVSETFTNSNVDGTSYSNDGLSWYAYMYNSFSYKKVWKLDISFNYDAASVWGFNTSQASYSLDAAISKKIANDRGTIKIGGHNLLSPNSYSYSQVLFNTIVHSSYYNYPRNLYITLSWKLGKTKHKPS